MAGQRRKSPAVALTSERLLDVLDRVYDLDTSELEWLHGIGNVLYPLMDCGAGISTWIWTTGVTLDFPTQRFERGHDVELLWKQILRVVPAEIATDQSLRTPISNATYSLSPKVRGYADAGHAAMGVHSLSGLNSPAHGRRFLAVCVPAPSREYIFWPQRDREAWEQIAAHLGAALRLRDRGPANDAPGLIFDVGGRLQHADPELAEHEELPWLRDVIASLEGARDCRLPPSAVLGAWQALCKGHWSIVQSVERNGRRFLVARPNVPSHRTQCATIASSAKSASVRRSGISHQLSDREHCVLVALAEGHSNKFIAYELGIAISTVATLLSRAARKLGCKNRIELVRAGRALASTDGSAGAQEL